jgi:hypothetical protein
LEDFWRVVGLNIPEGARKVIDEELRKLQELEPTVSEANATRNHLDWLTQVRSSLLLRCHKYMNFTGTFGSSLPRTTPSHTRNSAE